MKNAENWEPSKFGIVKGSLIPSKLLNIASRRMAQYVAEFYNYSIPKYINGNLLDMGCGNIPMYAFYKDRIDSVVCIDWENSAHEQKHVDVFCDLNGELPFANDTFDAIICSDVLEHLQDISKAISEIYRILRKGGVVLINYPFMYGLHEEPYDFARYTEYKIKILADNNKFNILELRVYGTVIDMFEHSSIRLIKLLPLGGYLSRIFVILIMPILSFVFQKRATRNNKHPYMYGFVFKK